MADKSPKEPSEVSGWGTGTTNQDASDIARDTQVNAEFDPEIGRATTAPRGAGASEEPKHASAERPAT
jgi:hypothetical protein